MGAADTEVFESRTAPVGLPAGTVHAARWTQTTVPAGTMQHEWNHVCKSDSYTASGDQCARYAQMNAYGQAAAWAGVDECCDMSFGSVYMPMQAIEADVWCAGDDLIGKRVGVLTVVGDAQHIRTGVRHDGPVLAGYGHIIGASSGTPWARWRVASFAHDFADHGYVAEGSLDPAHPSVSSFRASGCVAVAFDCSSAVAPIALRLKRGQVIALEHTGSVTVSVDDDYRGRISFKLCGVPFMEVDYNSGDLWIKGNINKLP